MAQKVVYFWINLDLCIIFFKNQIYQTPLTLELNKQKLTIPIIMCKYTHRYRFTTNT